MCHINISISKINYMLFVSLHFFYFNINSSSSKLITIHNGLAWIVAGVDMLSVITVE